MYKQALSSLTGQNLSSMSRSQVADQILSGYNSLSAPEDQYGYVEGLINELPQDIYDSQYGGVIKSLALGVPMGALNKNTRVSTASKLNPLGNVSVPSLSMAALNRQNQRRNPSTNPATNAWMARKEFGGTGSPFGLSTNAQALKASQEAIAAKNAAEFKPGAAFTGLTRGLVLSGLGASALSGLGAGALLGAETGVAAGNAATSGAGSLLANSLGNFATNAAIKGAVSGGLSGLTSGDGISGVLKGAGIGGITGGFAPGIGTSLGLGSAATQGLAGAASGAANSYISGGNPLLGAATGGLGSYVMSGGKIPGLGSIGGELGAGGMGPTTPSKGILGSVYNRLGDLGLNNKNEGEDMAWYDDLFSKNTLGSVANAGLGYYYNNKANDQLQKSQENALAALRPYLNQKFTAGDFTADPGYQFQLSEGQKAIDRSNAAKGSYYSGNALREAGDYATGLANTTYNDAYNRWLSQQQNNMQAAVQAGNIYSNMGNANANATMNKGNVFAGSLANILGTNKGGNEYDQIIQMLRSKGIYS